MANKGEREVANRVSGGGKKEEWEVAKRESGR